VSALSNMSLEFRCPKCGGRYFQTAVFRNEGQCSGDATEDRRIPCKFTWPRADDWKYFVLVEVTEFKSEDDYRKAQRAVDAREAR